MASPDQTANSTSPSSTRGGPADQPQVDPQKRGSIWEVAKQSVTAWSNDYASSMGAALAYYTLFSLAPLLLLVISVAGLVFGAEAARNQLVGQLGGLLGQEGATAVEGLLKSASQPAKSTIASIVSVVTLLIGATSIFAELQSDLDRIWRAPEVAKPAGIWGLVRTRLLSFGLVVSFGFLLLVSLVVSAGLAALGTWWGSWFGGWAIALQIVNQIVSLVFVTALFGLMYRILPSVQVAWRDVWHGAVATGILFTIGKFLIGLYLGKAGVSSAYGAAGSIVVLMVWVFYSSQIFLLGAEFTWLYAHNAGTRAVEAAEPGRSDQKEGSREKERSADNKGPASGVQGDGWRAPAIAASRRSAQHAPRPASARHFATAGLFWIGFGAIRSFLSRRTKSGA